MWERQSVAHFTCNVILTSWGLAQGDSLLFLAELVTMDTKVRANICACV